MTNLKTMINVLMVNVVCVYNIIIIICNKFIFFILDTMINSTDNNEELGSTSNAREYLLTWTFI